MGTSFEARLAEEAYKEWTRNPLFAPYFHETGRITAASSPNGIEEVTAQYHELLNSGMADGYEWLDKPEDFLKHANQLKVCKLEGWKGIYNPCEWFSFAHDGISSELKPH